MPRKALVDKDTAHPLQTKTEISDNYLESSLKHEEAEMKNTVFLFLDDVDRELHHESQKMQYRAIWRKWKINK